MTQRAQRSRSLLATSVGAAALLLAVTSTGLAQESAAPSGSAAAPDFLAAGQAEGELIVATAGGSFQDALGANFYDGFTAKTGIKVTPVTINPDEQWAKIKADSEAGNVEWDLVNVGPDSLVLQKDYLLDLGENCSDIPNLVANGAPGVCQGNGFLYILGGYIGAYDTNTFAGTAPTSTKDFFDTTTFPGPRCMASNEPTYGMMMALTADGVTQENLWPLDIDRALAKLDTIKPSIGAWWESGDQAMQNWRNGECAMSTFFAGRVKRLQVEGSDVPPKQMWQGFPRDISGFGVLKDAPHPNAAKAFIDYFFSQDAAQGAADFANTIFYDPANVLAIPLLGPVDEETRATNPDNWNAMVGFDIPSLQEQQTQILERWQEWISQ